MKKALLLTPLIIVSIATGCGDAVNLSAESAAYRLDIDWLVIGLLSGIAIGCLALLTAWKLFDTLSGGELKWRSKGSLETDSDLNASLEVADTAGNAKEKAVDCEKTDWKSKLTGNILPYILLAVIAVLLLRSVDCA